MKKLPTLSAVLILCVLCSCSVTQRLDISSTAPVCGVAGSDITVSNFFINVVQDLSSWQDTGYNDPVTDVAIADFASNLSNSIYASSVKFVKDGEYGYKGTFGFSDFEKLVSELCRETPAQTLLTLKTTGSKTRLDLCISLDNWETLTKIVPFLGERNFAVWGPVYNNPPYDYMTADDYKDLVGFILGEDGPEAIDNSSITIVLTTPSDIVSTNGTLKDKRTVEFSFPLIDFLLLHDDILFWCEF